MCEAHEEQYRYEDDRSIEGPADCVHVDCCRLHVEGFDRVFINDTRVTFSILALSGAADHAVLGFMG